MATLTQLQCIDPVTGDMLMIRVRDQIKRGKLDVMIFNEIIIPDSKH
jgi:hypothetical protein